MILEYAALITFSLVFCLSTIITGALVVLLKKKKIVDIPNERSLHSIPTPRGGGFAVNPSLFIGFILFIILESLRMHMGIFDHSLWPILLCFLAFILVFGFEDIKGLPTLYRLVAQIVITTIALFLLPQDLLVFQGYLPFWLDRTLTLFVWVGFINIYNFMDGMDGLAATETISIGFGLFLISLIHIIPKEIGLYGTFMAASALGFFIWNKHPAKIFMGDVGSIPLGFIIGWLLILMAGQGAWAQAIIIPLYYFMDAGLMLLKRLLQGKKIWQAHKEHAYQQAVEKGAPVPEVLKKIVVVNVCLILCASAASKVEYPMVWVVLSAAFVFFILEQLKKGFISAPKKTKKSKKEKK